ncbi:MAG: N-acetylmuramic acid 6-phosphate etherase [Gammaproteobacteria bacterium]
MAQRNNPLIDHLKSLISESQNPASLAIDLEDSQGIVSIINEQDHQVSQAITDELPNIARAVDRIVAQLQAGGRLIYIGAGTSGRMGVLDAVECMPTFGVDEDLVTAIMAGGKQAMFRAQEGAEDNADAGAMDLQNINLNKTDVVVGIAASGRTPYVIGALQYARQLGAATIAVSCNPESAISQQADVAIAPVVGPEVITGSTRMKAGTAQKLVLNMLSTASMIKLGKTYHNYMVDVKTTNEKLLARGTRMVMEITGVSQQQAEQTLVQADNSVKTALYMILAGVDKTQAEADLSAADGFLRRALQTRQSQS